MRLVPVTDSPDIVFRLWELLSERTPQESISHKKMPSMTEHEKFVQSNPYRAWFMIEVDGQDVGSIYLSRNNEIGVFIFRKYQLKGYGRSAVEWMMKLYPGPFLANVNPANAQSRKLWESMGGKLIQVTYQI